MENKVKINYPHSKNRFITIKEYVGPPLETVTLVNHNILNQRVTQCYEHMRERINKVEIMNNNTLKITTSTNMYAGD